ncbi:TPA: DUF3368 domain-containing protein [Candidatus Poribacteria bacterium]|nr:DUF3368 domain-containing protein [Candidatus Poribacteria bacterium]
MPIAIGDSSTLINLAAIGRLSLLREFYERIIVPQAVWEEVVVEGRGRPGAMEIETARDAGWIEVVTPQDSDLVGLLQRDLDRGEAEVIALAVERKVSIVLLDESEARRIAEIYGLPKTGVIGILLRAKLQGKIRSLKEELDRLRQEAGFWLAEDLYHRVLEEVNEGG